MRVEAAGDHFSMIKSLVHRSYADVRSQLLTFANIPMKLGEVNDSGYSKLQFKTFCYRVGPKVFESPTSACWLADTEDSLRYSTGS